MTCGIIIRAMDAADLEVTQGLMAQLGYDISAEDFAARFSTVTANPNHAVLVAERGGLLLGLVHIFIRAALEKPVEAVVQSLVVDGRARGTGIGRALMDRAEGWAQARGLPSVTLYSTLTRDDALAFYARLGYAEVARTALLRKML
ncbi:MAG: GNAT family N-acetyltransferase [Rhodospirillaceae bacterium]|nr:GNAT family N-acetyltransferase [Magnetovibrio sp.]MAY66160.1 GNAT family N-acetyltransferase [Rhodospirillaceae bacterium]